MTGGRWGVAAPHGSAVISLTYDRWWLAEVRGFAGTLRTGGTMWQELEGVCADFCLRWRLFRAYPGRETDRIDY